MHENGQKDIQVSYKKAERLSAAMYLITSFFSDSEPLKWQLRELGLAVLESISELRGAAQYEREHSVAHFSRFVHDILSLVEIASAAGMISEMNYRIIKAEYTTLRDEIEHKDSIKTPTLFELPKDFFSEVDAPPSALPQDMQEYSQGHNKGQNTNVLYNHYVPQIGERKNTGAKASVPMSALSQRTEHKKLPERNHSRVLQTKKATRSASAGVSTKGGRRDVVLGLFRNDAALTVKDVAKTLAGVSEKTAQRELAALVAEGVLKRTGERRWSMYSRA